MRGRFGECAFCAFGRLAETAAAQKAVLLPPGPLANRRFAKRLHCPSSTPWIDVQVDPANERLGLGACTFLLPLWVEPLLLIRGGINGSRIKYLGIYPKYIVNI